MPNELYDNQMLIKEVQSNQISFKVKDEIDVIWMSQETIADFFDITRKDVVLYLSNVLKENKIDKTKHIRTISYVKNSSGDASSIQERQYSFRVVSLLAFVIPSSTAIEFRKWVLNNNERFTKWGFLLDEKRVNSSDKRIQQVKRIIRKLNLN